VTSVTLRQAIERFRHRLLFVPLAFVVGSVALSRATLAIDRVIGDDQLPQAFETTVANGRAILSTIAGGLIAECGGLGPATFAF